MKKTFYVCKFTTDSHQIIEKTFNSLSKAKKYVREKILVNIKPGGFFNMLRGLNNTEGEKVADVLEKYLSDPNYEIHNFYSKYPLPNQDDDEDDEDNEERLYSWCVKEDGFRCEYNNYGSDKFISIVCKNPNRDDDDLETMYSGHFPTDENDYREDECWDDGWVGLVYKGREFYFVLDCGDITSTRFLDNDSLEHLVLVIDKVER